MIHVNTILRRTGVPLLILETINFRIKTLLPGHFKVIKGLNNQEDLRILSVHAPNKRNSHYIGLKSIELPREMENVAWDFNRYFNISLNTEVHRLIDPSSNWSIDYIEDHEGQDNTINQLALMDIYRMWLPMTIYYCVTAKNIIGGVTLPNVKTYLKPQ